MTTDELAKQIAAKAVAGLNARQIAGDLGVSYDTVASLARRRGIRLPPSPFRGRRTRSQASDSDWGWLDKYVVDDG